MITATIKKNYGGHKRGQTMILTRNEFHGLKEKGVIGRRKKRRKRRIKKVRRYPNKMLRRYKNK